METLTASIPMDYPGDVISVNHCYRRTRTGVYLEKEAKRWRDDLAESLQVWLLARRVRTVAPPIVVTVTATFLDRNNATDLDNLGKLTLDAIEAATGVNDREMAYRTEPPAYNPLVLPRIVITIELQGGRS